MGTHTATPDLTQAAYPWRATLRTVLAVGIPAFTLALIVAPQVIQAILAGYGPLLPASAQAWLLGAAAVITATAGVITRIMAIPAVIELTHLVVPFLAPAPRPVETVVVPAPAPVARPVVPVVPVIVPAPVVAPAPVQDAAPAVPVEPAA